MTLDDLARQAQFAAEGLMDCALTAVRERLSENGKLSAIGHLLKVLDRLDKYGAVVEAPRRTIPLAGTLSGWPCPIDICLILR